MKSHVSMAVAVCPVCLEEHDTGEILLDTSLEETLERCTYVGWDLCPIHKQEQEDGYVHLIAADNKDSDTVTLGSAVRTGNAVSMKDYLFEDMFGPVPKQRIAFITEETCNMLIEIERAIPETGKETVH